VCLQTVSAALGPENTGYVGATYTKQVRMHISHIKVLNSCNESGNSVNKIIKFGILLSHSLIITYYYRCADFEIENTCKPFIKW